MIGYLILGAGLFLNGVVIAKAPQLMMPHGSDIRTIAISLAEGDCIFTDLKIYGMALDERYIFAEGEEVFFNGRIRNNGSVDCDARIDKTDADTGDNLGYFLIPGLQAGVEVDIAPLGSVVYLGFMPNRNWNVTFTLTP